MDWLLRTVQPTQTPSGFASTELYPTVLQAISAHDHLKLAALVTAPGPSTAILAIVSNVDADHEQACILLLEPSPPANLLGALPVLTSFNVTLAERAPPEPRANDPSTGNILHCRLSVSGDQLIEVQVSTSDARQALRDMIVELRRLAAVAVAAQLTSVDQFGEWIDRYLGPRNTTRSGPRAASALARLLTEPSRPIPPTGKAQEDPGWPEWRRNWIRERLREREADYVSRRIIRVRIGTWNVYGKMPAESVGKWLVSDDEEPAQLYVICLQEIDDSSEAYIRHRPEREKRWSEVIERSLVTTVGPIAKLASQQLVGLLILIFAPTETSASCVSEVSCSYLGTGTLGIGNKGATAVRLRYCDTYLTFVNSHLAAFQAEVEARNRDYAEICRRLAFPPPQPPNNNSQRPRPRPKISVPTLYFVPGQGGLDAPSPSPLAEIFRTGHLFWAGDLNYRINLSYEEVKSLLESNEIEKLLKYDQLKIQIEKGRAFEGFMEGQIAFRPTYKFDVGSSVYDSSEKQRVPSFTDRILYLPGRANDVEVISYTSDEGPKMSDHKPVGATLSVSIYVIDDRAQSNLEGEMERELDGLENERMPDVGIEPEGVLELGKGPNCFNNGATVTVYNKRPFEVCWRIVPKLGDSEVCQDWLKISQVNGILRPGEKEAVHLALDSRALEDFIENQRRVRAGGPQGIGLDSEILGNSSDGDLDVDAGLDNIDEDDEGSRVIEDVIVLSVEGGRDIFIPVNVRI